jgi:acetyltransferase-like isoleucine patch superfamily enzyme
MRRSMFYFMVLLGLPKSIYLNIYYFSWKGFLLPILVTWRTRLTTVRGTIVIQKRIRFGIVRIGFNGVALSSFREWNVWNVHGQISIKGRVEFGTGSKLYVGPKAVITFGHHFLITARSQIICAHQIDFGDDVLVSWDVLIMDTDSHPIRGADQQITNTDKPIRIGRNVWIGCKTIILKGSFISDDSIVAAGTIITKAFSQSKVIIAGTAAQVVKENIVWKRENF